MATFGGIVILCRQCIYAARNSISRSIIAGYVPGKSQLRGLLSARSCSSNSPDNKFRNPTVVLSADKSTILCWHPEEQFPYEHTKPLPRREPELREGDSVMKVQYLLEEKHKYRPEGPTDRELAKMFYTTKHRWFSFKKREYMKDPNPPKDRESL